MSHHNSSYSREELIDMLNQILSGKLPDTEMSRLGNLIDSAVPHPDLISLLYLPGTTELRPAEAVIDEALAYEPVQIELPEWPALKKFSEQAALQFPHQDEFQQGLGLIGLPYLLEELYWSGYDCTPLNTVAFATAGSEGEHYSFLVEQNRIDTDSPVIYTEPAAEENCSKVVGANFYDFLCFGMHCGYADPLQVLHHPDDGAGEWFGEHLKPAQRQLLQGMIEEFHLQPWKSRHLKFEALQDQFRDKLQFHAGESLQ